MSLGGSNSTMTTVWVIDCQNCGVETESNAESEDHCPLCDSKEIVKRQKQE